MRPVFVHQYAVVIVMVECVTADMISAVADHDLLVEFACQSLGDHTPGKAGSHNQEVVHRSSSFFSMNPVFISRRELLFRVSAEAYLREAPPFPGPSLDPQSAPACAST